MAAMITIRPIGVNEARSRDLARECPIRERDPEPKPALRRRALRRIEPSGGGSGLDRSGKSLVAFLAFPSKVRNWRFAW
jgi:hypothetical protein